MAKNVLGMSDESFRNMPPPKELNNQYFVENYNTNLGAKDEVAFQAWAKNNNRLEDLIDYDLRGAWKQGAQQENNGHFPDTYKKPNHPTFSDQSIYHNTANPNGGKFVGGNWFDGEKGTYTFTPSREMVERPGYVQFMQEHYMPKVEPGNTFNMDRKSQ